MYVIGLDVSKYKHDCFIATEAGEVIKDTFSFTNDAYGFSMFLSVLNNLDATQEKRIGMEATGHYGNNLMRFLNQNGLDFMIINPFLTEKSRQALSLRKTKTDKIDARIISRMLLSLDYHTYSSKSYHISALKSLTRFRETLIKSRSLYKVQIQNILDLTFPKFSSFFSNVFGVLPLRILKSYPSPQKIAALNPLSTYTNLTKGLRGSFSYEKFKRIIEEAKITIGSSLPFYESELLSALEALECFDKQIDKVESEIEDIMNQYDFKILTIPGIGIQSAAVIVSEYGDFSLFESPAKMLAFAGMEPAIYQSGTQEFKGHMVKRGSPHLRYVLNNVVVPLISFNPVFSSYYWKKRNEGKHHRVACSHVVRKLLRVIYYLETHKVDFNPNLLK